MATAISFAVVGVLVVGLQAGLVHISTGVDTADACAGCGRRESRRSADDKTVPALQDPMRLQPKEPEMSAAEIRNRLNLLELERLEAESVGLLDNERYRWALDEEMAECRAAYVCAAVAEIASLRAELFGRQVG
jgi:hypothetical protein